MELLDQRLERTVGTCRRLHVRSRRHADSHRPLARRLSFAAGRGRNSSELQSRGIPFVVLTNGTAYPAAEQAPKLRALGLPISDEASADSQYRGGGPDAKATASSVPWCSVCPESATPLAEAGIEIVFPGRERAEEVQAVYVGWHPDCGMKDIEAACKAIWNGAELYVASDVPFLRNVQRQNDGLFACHHRRCAQDHPRAHDPHRQAFVARAEAGCKKTRDSDAQGGRRRRRSARRNDHDAARRSNRLWRDHRHHDSRGLGCPEPRGRRPHRIVHDLGAIVQLAAVPSGGASR